MRTGRKPRASSATWLWSNTLWPTALLLVATLALAACGEDDPPAEPEVVPQTAFETVSHEAWDETAVRQVLQVFALGSFASDNTIREWADMPPEEAIVQILRFDEFNDDLSPDRVIGRDGSLKGVSDYLSQESVSNPVGADNAEAFSLNSWDAPSSIWRMAIARTGPNPVLHRIGLFETNYHLAVNQDAGVNNWQMVRYYDDITDALREGRPYHEVLAVAAGSAAVATQYNHRNNEFVDGRFQGNEDFAREFHQLFFGIFGVDDPEHHELISIRNTAKMLTDMDVERIAESGNTDAHDDDEVTFGTALHYPGPLDILHNVIDGADAEEKIAALAALAIQHEESLDNLPLIIVGYLADDVIDEQEAATIRAAWRDLPEKNLLDFLRAYAISTTFHSPTRVKHWSSMERNVLHANYNTITWQEATLRLFDPGGNIRREGVAIFRPLKNVFGGQTGLDAIASGYVFLQAYNNSVERNWLYGRTTSENDAGNEVWRRDWDKTIPKGDDGAYRVRPVAEWLWQRFIADGLDNFGPLERAHVYALLGSGRDFGLFVNEDEPMNVYTRDEIETRADLVELVSDVSIAPILLDSGDDEERDTANRRVGLAINFIIATPFAFAQEGRQ